MFLRRLIGAADDFGEKLTEHIREKKADHFASLRAESAGGRVRNVFELVRDALDTVTGFPGNKRAVVQNARNCGNGDIRAPGYVMNCDTPSLRHRNKDRERGIVNGYMKTVTF